MLKLFFSSYRSVYIIQGCRITLSFLSLDHQVFATAILSIFWISVYYSLFVWFCSYQYKISNYEGSSCRLSRIWLNLVPPVAKGELVSSVLTFNDITIYIFHYRERCLADTIHFKIYYLHFWHQEVWFTDGLSSPQYTNRKKNTIFKL